MIINRFFLCSFDVFDLVYLMSNCKYRLSFAAKIFSSLKTTLDKENAEK